MEKTLKQKLKHSLLCEIWENNSQLNSNKKQKQKLLHKRMYLMIQLNKLKNIRL